MATMETRLVVLGEKPKPSQREINWAIATLASLDTGSKWPTGDELGEGDAILEYDLSLRSPGADPFRVKGRQVMHGILSEQGLPDAAPEVEAALLSMMRPLKTRALELVAGVASRGAEGAETVAEGDASARPRETPAQ